MFKETTFRVVLIGLLTLWFVLQSGGVAHAKEESDIPGGEAVPEEVLSPGEKAGDAFEQQQQRWSEYVTSTASYMDKFFDTDRFRSTSNKTYIRFRATPIYDRNGFSLSNYVDIRLQLPNTERWLVTFGGDPDSEDRYGSTPQQDAERERSGRDEGNAYIGVSTFFKKTRTRNILTGGGVRFRSRSIVPYMSAKWVELWDFNKWDIRLTERLRFYTDTGLEWKNQLDFDWPIDRKHSARVSGSITLEVDQPYKTFDIQYLLYRYLTTRRALQYKITTGYASQPSRSTYLDTVHYEVTYRQQWRDWFYTNITPYAVQSDDRDWKVDPGIRIDFNVVFGYTKDYKYKSQYDAKQEDLRKREWERLDEGMRELNRGTDED